jgi:hypothetical protein
MSRFQDGCREPETAVRRSEVLYTPRETKRYRWSGIAWPVLVGGSAILYFHLRSLCRGHYQLDPGSLVLVEEGSGR